MKLYLKQKYSPGGTVFVKDENENDRFAVEGELLHGVEASRL